MNFLSVCNNQLAFFPLPSPSFYCYGLGFRFTPPMNVFDTPESNPDNDCYCMVDEGNSCGRQGLFNISACKFGAPMAISWPHFLYGDPTLLEDVEGLNPNPNLHEFYIDFQPVIIFSLQ